MEYHDLPPDAFVVEYPMPKYAEGGLTPVQVSRSGMSWAEELQWYRTHPRHYQLSGTPPLQVPERSTNYNEVPEIPEVAAPETSDETMWRTAVMYTVGKTQLDPHALQTRLEHAMPLAQDSVLKLVTEMQRRGVIGAPTRYGTYEVKQKHSDTPEAVRSVALHLSRIRAEKARAIANRDDLTTAQKVEQIDEISSDLNAAGKSLNIPISEMAKIAHTLDGIGFLKVPIIGIDLSGGDKKWTQFYTNYEVASTRAYLLGGAEDQQESLEWLYDQCPAPYDSNRVALPSNGNNDQQRTADLKEQRREEREGELNRTLGDLATTLKGLMDAQAAATPAPEAAPQKPAPEPAPAPAAAPTPPPAPLNKGEVVEAEVIDHDPVDMRLFNGSAESQAALQGIVTYLFPAADNPDRSLSEEKIAIQLAGSGVVPETVRAVARGFLDRLERDGLVVRRGNAYEAAPGVEPSDVEARYQPRALE